MNKVLILTYYWPPSGGPGVQRWLKFVKFLPQLGYEPYVITVDAHKATYPVKDFSLEKEVPSQAKVYRTSTREPYRYYQKLSGQKQVPYSGFANAPARGWKSSISRFIRGNLFVPDARIGWNRYAIEQAKQLIREHQIDTLVTTSPPHSTQLAGLQLKKTFPRLRWIADLRDPWTDIFYYDKMLHLPFIRKKDQKLEQQVLKNADVVLVVSDQIRRIFAEKLPCPHHTPIEVIPNGYDPDDFTVKVPPGKSPVFTISYTGTLAEAYDLSGLIEALKTLTATYGKGIRLQLTGQICPKWKQQLHEHLPEITHLNPHVGHDEAIRQMQSSDLLLLVIPNLAHNEGIVTGKIFEYLAASRPILGIGPVQGDAAAILEKTGHGKMFAYPDDKGMRQYIQDIMNPEENWQPNPKAIQYYSRKYQTQKLIQLFQHPKI